MQCVSDNNFIVRGVCTDSAAFSHESVAAVDGFVLGEVYACYVDYEASFTVIEVNCPLQYGSGALNVRRQRVYGVGVVD